MVVNTVQGVGPDTDLVILRYAELENIITNVWK
jgi:Holliday junction resolvasome RuvABC DNA-binding subunit